MALATARHVSRDAVSVILIPVLGLYSLWLYLQTSVYPVISFCYFCCSLEIDPFKNDQRVKNSMLNHFLLVGFIFIKKHYNIQIILLVYVN